MEIHPKRYKAYDVCGQNVFPVYGASGNVCADSVGILFTGLPKIFNGGDFGMDNEIRSDEGGAWIVVRFGFMDENAAIAEKVRIAEEKLDQWKP